MSCSRPARSSDDLPAPDAATTITGPPPAAAASSLPTRSAFSRSRPKNHSACSLVNAAKPGYGHYRIRAVPGLQNPPDAIAKMDVLVPASLVDNPVARCHRFLVNATAGRVRARRAAHPPDHRLVMADLVHPARTMDLGPHHNQARAAVPAEKMPETPR